MNEKINHTNLCMDEISSFVEKIISVFIVKKKYFDLSKYQICFVGCKKKVLWCQKFRSVLLYKKKKKEIFDDKSLVLFLLYILKKDFLRRKLRS